jgi:hypothetical protein
MSKSTSRQVTDKMRLLSAPDFKTLHKAWQNSQLILFLGAGVSFDYGLPSWKTLVLDLLFENVADGSQLRNVAINYRRAVSDWLANYFEYGPVVLARLIEDYIIGRKSIGNEDNRLKAKKDFLVQIQQNLYADRISPTGRTGLKAIAELIAQNPKRTPAVITFNFDDLLEQELRELKVPCESVFKPGRISYGIVPVIHVHGYIPQMGTPPVSNIVFTERDYHALTEGVFHWALTEIVWHLRHNTVLFVGLSMSDPNLRRLLDAAFTDGQPTHYQLQKRHQVPQGQHYSIMQQIDDSAREWKGRFQRGIEKQPAELFNVLTTSLHQADIFDSQLFEKMGIRTIWVNGFEDIPKIISEIMD